MKRTKRIAAGVASLAMVASMALALPMGASAANSTFTYTSVAGGTDTIKKYLVLDNDTTVPTASFSYTIAAGTPVNYAGATGTTAAYAGLNPTGITISTASFAAGDTTVAGTATDGITNSADKKYVVKDVTIDFSAVNFTEPGVYRYIVTETNAGTTDNLGAGITHLGNYEKTLDVYVTDKNDGTKTLEVSSYVLYNSVINTAPAIDDSTALVATVDRTDTSNTSKTDGFVNEYSSQDLTFGKTVAGNQGSRDKYFKYTVTIANASGANLTIDTSKSSFDAAPAQNSATIYTEATMATANGKDENATVTGQQLVINSNSASYDFYLQNGQYITLLGLPKGSTYTVTEDAEEYTSVAADTTNFTLGTITFDDATTGTIATSDIETGFTNTKNGTIPTGILLSVAAPAGVGIVVIGGIAYLLIKNKRRKAEEE